MMFCQKIVVYDVFLRVALQKARVCSAAGRRGTRGKSGRQDGVSYHMEVRTLYCYAYLGNKHTELQWQWVRAVVKPTPARTRQSRV